MFGDSSGVYFVCLLQISLEAGKANENVEVIVKTDDKRIMLAAAGGTPGTR
jgi:hypothetical protein